MKRYFKHSSGAFLPFDSALPRQVICVETESLKVFYLDDEDNEVLSKWGLTRDYMNRWIEDGDWIEIGCPHEGEE